MLIFTTHKQTKKPQQKNIYSQEQTKNWSHDKSTKVGKCCVRVKKENGCKVPFWNPAFRSQNPPFVHTPVESLHSYSKIQQQSSISTFFTIVIDEYEMHD